MADPIKYTRTTFQHVDWTDNVSRVRADGDDGFNIRFHALEAEFDQISKTFDKVSAALDALGQKPPPKPINITLTPVLEKTADVGWTHQQGFAQKLGGQTGAEGMMSVNLPNGVKISTFRITGRNADSTGNSPGIGLLLVSLKRQKVLIDTSPPDLIVRVQGAGSSFNSSLPADAQFATVDTDQFKYFIIAQLNSAAPTDIVQLTAFQITYQSQ